MPGFKEIANVWKNVREIDLRPIRQEAETPVKLAIVGAPGVGRHTLADQMRRDPSRPQQVTTTSVLITALDGAEQAKEADLIILMADAANKDLQRERQLADAWRDAGKQLLIFVNKVDTLGEGHLIESWVGWRGEKMIAGSALNVNFLQNEFVPVVLMLLPDRHLPLARQFPLFRMQVAKDLINDTCISNAAYALSTGLAEIVPVLDIPLNITDMMVLSKAQAFLVYRIGLALGYTTRWQDYIGEFGGVIGTGFLWRQIARELVGLIPVWGIVPKVAVAYAGTFVTGNTVLQWYLTGRRLSPKQVRDMYAQALVAGKAFAKTLLARAPRPRLGRRKKTEVLPPGAVEAAQQAAIEAAPQESTVLEPVRTSGTENIQNGNTKEESNLPTGAAAYLPARPCPHCGKLNAADAVFCQYCGKPVQS